MAKQFKPETLCVQAGWTPKKGEPRVLPIYQSTTFKYDTSEQMARLFDLEDSGYFYTRLQNPTNDAVAAKIAALEGGVAAMLTSSGQAAKFYAIFNICQCKYFSFFRVLFLFLFPVHTYIVQLSYPVLA